MEIESAAWGALVRDGAAAMGIRVSPAQAALFARHGRALLAWNRTTNLTAITRPEDVAVKHFIDALVPSTHIPEGSTVLDIGAGGGFPGVPLKIACPSLHMTLIDSVRKKASFLGYLIRELGLQGISARHVRAEALATRPDMAGGFDVVICRALTALADFIRMARPLVKAGGAMIAMKGEISDAEIEAAAALAADPQMRGTLSIEVRRYTLPFLDLPRRLYIIRPRQESERLLNGRSSM